MAPRPGSKFDLEKISQRSGEPLRDYIRRFQDTRLTISSISDSEVITAFLRGLRSHSDLRSRLHRKPPTTVADMFDTANRYA